MPRKKKSPSTEIIRAITGYSVDPLAEKALELLILRYRKNRAGGQNKGPALKGAALGLLEAVTGFRIPTPQAGYRPRTAWPRANPAQPKEESDLEIIVSLKRELDTPPKT